MSHQSSEVRKGDEPSAPPPGDHGTLPPLAVGVPYAGYTGYGAAPPTNAGYAYSGGVGAPGYPVGAQGYQGGGVSGPGYAYGAAYASSPGDKMEYGDGQGQPTMDPRNLIVTGRWDANLCSCMDSCFPNFFMAWCCPCISLAQIYARVGLLPYSKALGYFVALGVIGWIGYFFSSPHESVYTYDPETGYAYDTTATVAAVPVAFSIIMTIDQVLFRLIVWFARAKVREQFLIPGGVCGDGFASCCCSCCAIAQLATHVKSYTPGSCSFSGPDVLPAYVV